MYSILQLSKIRHSVNSTMRLDTTWIESAIVIRNIVNANRLMRWWTHAARLDQAEVTDILIRNHVEGRNEISHGRVGPYFAIKAN